MTTAHVFSAVPAVWRFGCHHASNEVLVDTLYVCAGVACCGWFVSLDGHLEAVQERQLFPGTHQWRCVNAWEEEGVEWRKSKSGVYIYMLELLRLCAYARMCTCIREEECMCLHMNILFSCVFERRGCSSNTKIFPPYRWRLYDMLLWWQSWLFC